MKKFAFLLSLCLLLIDGAQAHTNAFPGQKRYPAMSWQEQIVAYLSYPEVLLRANQEGVVTLSFLVTADNWLTSLQVHTDNEKLKANLIKQLTGKKLHGSPLDPHQTHTVRLRFQLTD